MNLVMITTFFGHGLTVLVFCMGFLFALSKLRHYPTPALLVMGGTGTLLLLQIFHIVAPLILPQFLTTSQFSLYYGVISLVSGCLRAAAIGLFVVAAFIARVPSPSSYAGQGGRASEDNPYGPLA